MIYQSYVSLAEGTDWGETKHRRETLLPLALVSIVSGCFCKLLPSDQCRDISVAEIMYRNAIISVSMSTFSDRTNSVQGSQNQISSQVIPVFFAQINMFQIPSQIYPQRDGKLSIGNLDIELSSLDWLKGQS